MSVSEAARKRAMPLSGPAARPSLGAGGPATSRRGAPNQIPGRRFRRPKPTDPHSPLSGETLRRCRGLAIDALNVEFAIGFAASVDEAQSAVGVDRRNHLALACISYREIVAADLHPRDADAAALAA